MVGYRVLEGQTLVVYLQIQRQFARLYIPSYHQKMILWSQMIMFKRIHVIENYFHIEICTFNYLLSTDNVKGEEDKGA